MKKTSWVNATANMFIADAIAQHSTKGTLGQRHAQQIALRYALKSEAIYRASQIKKWLLISGAIGLVVFVVINWR